MSTLSVQNLTSVQNVTVANITATSIITTNVSAINCNTSNLYVNSVAISAVTGAYKNKIINGNFDIWQRGTSNGMTGYYTADRWASYNTGTTKVASQQAFTLGQTAVPGEPTYFMRHVVTSSAAAGNLSRQVQSIESVQTLAGKTATLSFWAKADSSKNIATEVYQDFGTGGSPSTAVTGIGVTTHALTSSWQKFFVTASITSISGKTLGSNNNDHLGISFWFDAGSSFNARTNNLGQQSGTFDIAQVQVEEGPVATAFEQRHIGQELALCLRYYQTLVVGGWVNQTNFNVAAVFNFTEKMRVVPTGTFGVAISSVNAGTPTLAINNSNGGYCQWGDTTGLSNQKSYIAPASFDAEL